MLGKINISDCLNDWVSKCDVILYSGYKDGTETLPCTYIWWPVDTDQRPMWSKSKQKFGYKSSSNWIGAHKDLSDYNDLLGHARNLGLHTIWDYHQLAHDDEYSDDNIYQFCDNAWYQYFLRRYSQKVSYYYKCTDADCETCNSPNGTWVLYNVIYFNEYREDIPPAH